MSDSSTNHLGVTVRSKPVSATLRSHLLPIVSRRTVRKKKNFAFPTILPRTSLSSCSDVSPSSFRCYPNGSREKSLRLRVLSNPKESTSAQQTLLNYGVSHPKDEPSECTHPSTRSFSLRSLSSTSSKRKIRHDKFIDSIEAAGGTQK